jgi:predicted ribosomally synthesized peptide with nif11-like leader
MAGLKEFFEKLGNDTELQEKVKAARDENALLKVITDAGYDVKLEELKKFVEEVRKEGALSDDDLDNAAGGMTSAEELRAEKLFFGGFGSEVMRKIEWKAKKD